MLTAFGGKLGEVIRIRGGYLNAASMVALVALRVETRAGMLAVSHDAQAGTSAMLLDFT